MMDDEFIKMFMDRLDRMLEILTRIAEAMEEGIAMENEEINRRMTDKGT